jgi:c-di-GMP-related signal transduction protein
VARATLRSTGTVDQLAGALPTRIHSRTRVVAGLLAVAQSALGLPADQLADALELNASLRDLVVTRTLPLGALLDAIEAFENGWWDDLAVSCAALNINPQVLSETWLGAWRAAKEELNSLKP